MLPRRAADELTERGHDALCVADAGLTGSPDDEVFARAVTERRVMVTENVADYAALLTVRLGGDEPSTPVIFVRKSAFPRRGALATHLAARLDEWAKHHPDPYVGAHWL
jgi:hypothetical protein